MKAKILLLLFFVCSFSAFNTITAENDTSKTVKLIEKIKYVTVPIGGKTVRIDTSSLPSGIYVVSYVVDGHVVDSHKFSK